MLFGRYTNNIDSISREILNYCNYSTMTAIHFIPCHHGVSPQKKKKKTKKKKKEKEKTGKTKRWNMTWEGDIVGVKCSVKPLF